MLTNKTCKNLGEKIKQHLVKLDLEQLREFDFDNQTKITKISQAYKDILTILGLQTSEFEQTSFRISRMFVEEIFYGLNYDNFPACALYENKFKYNGILTQKNINIMSFCEHHFMPFEGVAEVSFIPQNTSIIGLCKINNICDFFSRRPQIQERLTMQIFETLKFILQTEDISVTIAAKHTCVSFRNASHKNSETFTKKTGGFFTKKGNYLK